MSEDLVPPEHSVSPVHREWIRTARWVLLALIVVGAGLFIFQSLRNLPREAVTATGEFIERSGAALSSVAAAFKKGTMVSTFTSYATTVTGNQYLQFATLKQNELFSHAQRMTYGGFPLPEVVVEARAPVEYTYYLDFRVPWRLELQDEVVHVYAPPIRFNKPAVDASAITYEVRKGYFQSGEVQEELKRMVTGVVLLKAKENINLVRETGRKQTAEFVEQWLEKTFTDGKRHPVLVHFPDEGTNARPPALVPVYR